MLTLPHDRLWDAVAPRVPPALIGPPQWRALTAVMARLPPIFSWGIFECRLASDPRVDLLLCVTREAATTAAVHTGCTALAGIAPFLAAWCSDPRLAASPLFWLEHDVHADGPSSPFVQFCVDPGYPRSAQPPLPARAMVALAAAGVDPLLSAVGRRVSPGALDRLEAAAAQLPAGGRILHVGVMPHRQAGDPALRVLSIVPVGHALDWLAAVGWAGDFAAAGQLLAYVAARFARVSIQLDLGEQVGPILAVEFPHAAVSGDDRAWQTFMAAIARDQLADATKARAALAWIGHQSLDLPDADWRVGIARQLDVKLSLGPGLRREAKAYLSFQPRYVPL